jgi:hypothetical protein
MSVIVAPRACRAGGVGRVLGVGARWSCASRQDHQGRPRVGVSPAHLFNSQRSILSNSGRRAAL